MTFIISSIIIIKAFRILGLDERKGRCRVVEQDFHGNFLLNVTWFLAFFSGVLDWIVFIPACPSQRTKLSMTIKADDVKTGRKEVDPLGRLWAAQGENELIKRKYCKIKKYALLTSTT